MMPEMHHLCCIFYYITGFLNSEHFLQFFEKIFLFFIIIALCRFFCENFLNYLPENTVKVMPDFQ